MRKSLANRLCLKMNLYSLKMEDEFNRLVSQLLTIFVNESQIKRRLLSVYLCLSPIEDFIFVAFGIFVMIGSCFVRIVEIE